MAHYIFNVATGDAAEANGFLRVKMWGVDRDEPHGSALAVGDLALIYLAAPARQFIGRAELASALHDWTEAEAQVYPGDSRGGVLLARVEEWDPPVSMSAVLARLEPTDTAKADFNVGVVQITAGEYETAVAVAAASSP